MKHSRLFPLLVSMLISSLGVAVLPVHAAVGPASSSQIEQINAQSHTYRQIKTNTKLNVVVPVFDPNIPADADEYEKLGIWPEVRNTEANLFAIRLRDAMQDSGVFGAVRVTPNAEAIAELYVMGKIIKSTSEIVELEIGVQDISQSKWFRKPRTFEYRVREYDLSNPRTKDLDPYGPIFAEITAEIIDSLSKKREKKLADLQQISSLTLAQSYAENTFGNYLTTRRNGTIKLREVPAVDDPKYQRVMRIRTREDIFVDELQNHYQLYSGQVGESYRAWQKDSFPEAKEYRLQRAKVRRQRGLGVLSVLAGAALATNAGNSDAARVGAIAGGVAGGALIYQSFRTSEASKAHLEQLQENGQTLDLELGPQNIEFEGKTQELTGTASEQFQQHREFLQDWYASEATPEVQL